MAVPRATAAIVLSAATIAAAFWLVSARPGEDRLTGLAALRVPGGFRVERIAGPELLSYGMLGTVDERGRLYVCESSGRNVRNEEMKANPEYRVKRLEDVNGDGFYDRATVFARRLTMPAGAAWVRSPGGGGSLYVASPPDLIRFTDTDDDGVADKKEIVVTGWNLSSNAASLHGPILGPDGWLYLTDGRHGFKIRSKEGVLYEGRASRIWRVRPDGSGLEWVAGGGFDNPVEVVFTNAGEMIGTMTYFTDPRDGLRDALLHFVEGGVYPKWFRVVDEFKRTGELMPVMTKFARIAPSGLTIARSDAWGPEYKGNLYSAQFNPHRVQRHILNRDGATFRTEDQDFLTSSDPDFHPTDVFEDADGSLIVIDTGAWFLHGCPLSRISKPAIRGAVYRIRKVGATEVSDPRGEKLDWNVPVADLAARLQDARPMVSDRASDWLVEHGDAAVAALRNIRATQAIFVLGRIGTPAALEAVRAALTDGNPEVRTVAARCLGLSRDIGAVPGLSALLRENAAPVRRQAAAALGQIGDVSAAPALVDASEKADDRFLEHSIIYSLIQLRAESAAKAALRDARPLVRKAALIALDQMDGSPLERSAAVGLLADRDAAVRSAALWVASRHAGWAGDVVAHLRTRVRQGLNAEEADSVRDALLAYVANDEARKLVRELLEDSSPERRALAFDVIERAAVKEVPLLWGEALARQLESPDRRTKLRALGVFRSRAITGYDDRLRQLVASGPEEFRLAAISALIARHPRIDAATEDFLVSQLDPRKEATVRMTAAQLVARAQFSDNGLKALLDRVVPAADPLVIPSLLEALGRGPRFAAETRKLKAQLAGAQRAREEKLRALEPVLTSQGDPGRGRQVFFGEKAGCSGCHRIQGEGNDVGPDLTAIGAIRSGHDLLEAIVFPSASFVPGHEIYKVTTATEVLSGVVKENEPGYVVLTSGPGEIVRIPRDRIKRMDIAEVSIMPDGFDETLTRAELTDLLAYLQSQKTGQARAMR